MVVHPLGSRQPLRLLRRRGFLALGLSAIGLLGACAAPPTPAAAPSKPVPTSPPAAKPATTPVAKAEPPKPAATAAPAIPKSLTKVRFGTTSLLFQSVPYYMGVEKGFYREQGIDLTIQHHEGDSVVQKALVAGEIDVADMSPPGGLVLVDKGAPIKAIGSIDPYIHYVLIVRKDINSLADFYGRNVGISSPGSLPEVVVRALMDREGLDPNKVNWVQLGGGTPARLQAVLAGKTDVAPNTIDSILLVQNNPDVKVLLTVKDKLPELLRGALWVQEKDIREKNDILVRQMVGHLRAVRYALDNKQETINAGAKILGKDKPEEREEMSVTFDFYIKSLWEPSGRLDPKAFQFLQEMNIKLGTQSKVQPIDKVYTSEIIDKALAIAGPYRKA